LYEDWAVSEDGIFGRAVTIYQHQKGYRFSLDAVLLAAFAVERGLLLQQRMLRPLGAVDLCTGSGIVPLAALFLAERIGRFRAIEDADLFEAWQAVEYQASMVSLARANIQANRRDETISLVHTDLRMWRPVQSVEIITCNPPYQPVASGDVSRHPERAIARHEIQGDLAEIAEAARTMVSLQGVSLWVFPAERSARLLGVLQRVGWRVTHLRWVHPFEDAPAALVLIEAQPTLPQRDESATKQPPSRGLGASEVTAQSPISSRCVLQHEHRVYTPMIEALLQGDPFLWLEQ
jgi:tRNA1Val (adenine37-N6)-methyltransferase